MTATFPFSASDLPDHSCNKVFIFLVFSLKFVSIAKLAQSLAFMAQNSSGDQLRLCSLTKATSLLLRLLELV